MMPCALPAGAFFLLDREKSITIYFLQSMFATGRYACYDFYNTITRDRLKEVIAHTATAPENG
jgi:hypothetical protein